MDGIRVIDLSRGVPGEFCARILSGYGAEVIKVEDLERPSETRGIPPFLGNLGGDTDGALFWHVNSSKRSMALDLGSKKGTDTLLTLAAVSDIVVEDRTPGELDQMGVGYRELRGARPDLILTSVTPFGQTGPMSQHIATELGVLAASGELSITGVPDREPIKPGGRLGGHAAGLQAAVATVGAVCLRQESGAGQHIDVSSQEAAAMFLCGGPTWFHLFSQSQGRVGARVAQALIRGGYSGNIVRCSDGYLWFGAGHNQDMIALLVEEPKLDSVTLWQRPGEYADEIDAAIERWTSSRTREEVTRLAQELRIAVAPVLTLEEVCENPQHAARGFFRSTPHPSYGVVPGIGPPVVSDRLPWSNEPAPGLGQHNGEVIGDLLGGGGSHRTGRSVASGTEASLSNQPLAGVRILDLTTHVAGPYGTLVLASMGAEVLKIERPWVSELREAHRVVPPAKAGAPDEPYNRPPWFNEVNRGKRSFPIDLTSREGRELVMELIAVSDVIVSNFSNRVMENLQLDVKAVRQIRPDIIYATLSGYGSTGPASSWSAAGPAVDAASGLAWMTGYPGGPPLRPGNFAPDLIAGLSLSLGILMALYRRSSSGLGDRIDLSMLESVEQMIGGELIATAFGIKVPVRQGNDVEALAPYGCFPCEGDDSWVAIGVESDEQWRALCEVIDQPWCGDVRFEKAEGRWASRRDLHLKLSDWTRNQDRSGLVERVQEIGVAAVAVFDSEDQLRSPHLWERGYFQVIEHPQSPPTPYPRLGWHSEAWDILGPAPVFAEHLEGMGNLLGLPLARIENLVASGVLAREPRYW